MPRLALCLLATLVVVLGLACGLTPREALGEEESLLQAQDESESPYGLWVGDTPVTDANKDDVLGTTDEGATVKFAPADGQNPAKLTLDGANITTGHKVDGDNEGVFFSYGIYYTDSEPLTIAVASDGTVDVSEITGVESTAGIFSEHSDLTITGAGKLTAKGTTSEISGNGIAGLHNVTIDNGVVDATGESGGIMSREGGVVITNDSTVEANGGIYGKAVTIDSGIVKANGVISGDSVTIRGGEVIASNGYDHGIKATPQNDYPGTVTITGGTVSATGGAKGCGIYVGTTNGPNMSKPCIVTITGGTVSATGGVNGIYAENTTNYDEPKPGTVTITGGTVSATGGAAGCGIYAQASSEPVELGNVTIGDGITSVIASGGTQAVDGAVTNAVAGMGWTDAAGTQDKTVIAAKADGQDLGAYKKVQFPTPVAKVTTAPEATNPTYVGEARALVTTGKAEGGTMRYSLNGITWSDKVPMGTEVGSYTVWYMVAGDAQHVDSESQSVTSTISAKTFSDVPEDAWFYDVVCRATGLGLFSGYGSGNFGSGDKTTRGQAAVVLWNMAGHPEASEGTKAFPDVRANMYYADAVAWASSAGVVSGYGDGMFGPDDPVAREQLAAMLANYARNVAKRDTPGSAADYSAMKDAAKVSGWAENSVGWCFRSKIMSGTEDGYVNPQGNATRAEAAKMTVCLHDMP